MNIPEQIIKITNDTIMTQAIVKVVVSLFSAQSWMHMKLD